MSSILNNLTSYAQTLDATIGNIHKFTEQDQKRSNKKFIKDIGYEMPVFSETAESVIVSFRSAKHSVSCEISKPKETTWVDMMGPTKVSHIELIYKLMVGDPRTGETGDIHSLVALSSKEFGEKVCGAMNQNPYTNKNRHLATKLWRCLGFSLCFYRLRALYMLDEMEREGASEGEVLIASYQGRAAHENSKNNEDILTMAFPTATMNVSVV